MFLGSKYGIADIQGYLRDQESNYVILHRWNRQTLVKFQKWGLVIVKIITKHFSNNLADKKSKFIPKRKLHEMKVKRQSRTNYLIINGHVTAEWHSFNPKDKASQKLTRLIKNYK